jgi:hypothetical protein
MIRWSAITEGGLASQMDKLPEQTPERWLSADESTLSLLDKMCMVD